MTAKIQVGILGATGAVGQRFVQLLEGHPWFEVTALYASERSAGRPYGEVVDWRVPVTRPTYLDDLVVRRLEPDGAAELVFSALPKAPATEIEPRFAGDGAAVVSNASAYRMAPDVPLLIPEVNPEHTALIPHQRRQRGWQGCLITNPNCSVVGLVVALKPIHDAFGLLSVQVTTMQAKSGAGYPGPPPEIIGDNVLPFIGGEEDKLETEPAKLLGVLVDGEIQPADITVSAQCHRVDVLDGHLEAVSVALETKPSTAEMERVLREFQGLPQEAGLPSAPAEVIRVAGEEDRPQPRLDRDAGKGMTVTVGRLRPCPVLDFKFVVLSHNTIRGAAGAALLNAELLCHQGYLSPS